jgi:hypothetical protein
MNTEGNKKEVFFNFHSSKYFNHCFALIPGCIKGNFEPYNHLNKISFVKETMKDMKTD